MKKFNKRGMYAGVSAAALGLAFIAAPAAAFDDVDWRWDAEINEVITKTIDIDADFTPTGMIMLEDLQVSIGDHSATSTVTNVFNNQPVGNGDLEGEIQFLVDYIDSAEYELLGGGQGSIIDSEVTLTVVEDGIVFRNGTNTVSFGCSEGGDGAITTSCEGQGNFQFTIDLSQFDVGDVIVLDPLDATTELPEVISTATAVANNTAIQSDASIQLHEGQFAFGGGNGSSFNGDFDELWAELDDDVVNGEDDDWNSNLAAASTLGSAAILGLLDKANITADSTVNNIHNATVDSTATAVANNMTVELEGQGADRLLIGDVVQFSYADTTATSTVSEVYLNNYEGLGLIDRPIVNSVATAVGNNKSITVSAGGIFDNGNGTEE
ncbi:hypothetical protein [Fodinicurvata sp. EGI_FJ10296]|uniref:hypothetical protein n=1 Tax=Fodinicurvata sp. EGI_FJ10296 TaxID=3231908 RepID=UPI0034565382